MNGQDPYESLIIPEYLMFAVCCKKTVFESIEYRTIAEHPVQI